MLVKTYCLRHHIFITVISWKEYEKIQIAAHNKKKKEKLLKYNIIISTKVTMKTKHIFPISTMGSRLEYFAFHSNHYHLQCWIKKWIKKITITSDLLPFFLVHKKKSEKTNIEREQEKKNGKQTRVFTVISWLLMFCVFE